MAGSGDDDQREIEHPNRKKASSKLVRLIVVVLLLASAVLVAVVSVGAWSTTEGAKPLQVVFILVDLIFAFFVLRWTRGVLPMIAAISTLLLIFAAVATPGWFQRDRAGFTSPALDESTVGLLTALMIPLEAALLIFAMAGFRQGWNVEVEKQEDDEEAEEEPSRGRRPAPA